jgi:hypothetical protein
MRTKRHIRFAIAPFFLTFFFCGCSGYENAKLQPAQGEIQTSPVKRLYPTIEIKPTDTVTIQDLKEKWRDFIIRYADIYRIGPAAVIFDPKSNDKTIQSDNWIRVKNQETLSEVIKNIQRGLAPKLFKILGPDDQFYGYIFCAYKHDEMEVYVSIRSLDANTLQVAGTLVRGYAPP